MGKGGPSRNRDGGKVGHILKFWRSGLGKSFRYV